MKWHHYAGLLFGVVTFTWAISGMLSLSPFAALGSKPAEDTLVHAPAGGSFDISLVGSPQVRDGARAIEAEFPPKELEYVQFRGAPYFLAYRPPEAHDPEGWTDTDIAAYLSENLNRDHVLVSAKLPENGLFSRFPDHAMADVARQAMPGVAIRDEVWLEEYDAYYYDRSGANPLPVLRVRFEDPDETWLYLNPQHGTIIRRNQKASRLNRWLYQGLHSLDFPFMYYSRPLWDIVVIALSIGGLALSATTLVPALRRLGRRSRELGRRVFS
jgi:hypothetical protein